MRGGKSYAPCGDEFYICEDLVGYGGFHKPEDFASGGTGKAQLDVEHPTSISTCQSVFPSSFTLLSLHFWKAFSGNAR